MDLEAIAAGWRPLFEPVTGLRVADFIPEKPEPPMLIPVPRDPFIDYHSAMGGGLAELHFDLVLLVQRGDDRSAQKNLNQLLSSGTGMARSLIDCLAEGDRTMSGATSDIVIRAVTGYGRAVEIGDSTYGQAVLTTDVYATRT